MDGGQTTIDLGTSILKAKYLTKLVSTVAFLWVFQTLWKDFLWWLYIFTKIIG